MLIVVYLDVLVLPQMKRLSVMT